MPRNYDEARRTTAARLQEIFPSWFIMWGTYSRRYWAYPCFGVPRGTIAHAADANDLAAAMRAIQISATEGRW
jgi:hypothetical protein